MELFIEMLICTTDPLVSMCPGQGGEKALENAGGDAPTVQPADKLGSVCIKL